MFDTLLAALVFESARRPLLAGTLEEVSLWVRDSFCGEGTDFASLSYLDTVLGIILKILRSSANTDEITIVTLQSYHRAGFAIFLQHFKVKFSVLPGHPIQYNPFSILL